LSPPVVSIETVPERLPVSKANKYPLMKEDFP